ncbi:MAG: hypothetical protein H6923_03060 [Alphaproteobacteria bacterium]|nr:hypothetical protein [Alphaproteobacteria bacterium]
MAETSGAGNPVPRIGFFGWMFRLSVTILAFLLIAYFVPSVIDEYSYRFDWGDSSGTQATPPEPFTANVDAGDGMVSTGWLQDRYFIVRSLGKDRAEYRLYSAASGRHYGTYVVAGPIRGRGPDKRAAPAEPAE